MAEEKISHSSVSILKLQHNLIMLSPTKISFFSQTINLLILYNSLWLKTSFGFCTS